VIYDTKCQDNKQKFDYGPEKEYSLQAVEKLYLEFSWFLLYSNRTCQKKKYVYCHQPYIWLYNERKGKFYPHTLHQRKRMPAKNIKIQLCNIQATYAPHFKGE